MKNIGVIGGGAAGISFAYNAIKNKIVNNCREPISIKIFDRSGFNGGVAYCGDFDGHILNMPPETMSADIFNSLHFSGWLSINSPRYKKCRYPPRRLYREYLNAILVAAASMAEACSVKFDVVRAEVDGLAENSRGYLLTTACGAVEQMDAVIMCSGYNQPECIYPVEGVMPYRASQNLSAIDHSSRIGVIGSGLTAIDAIIELTERVGANDICTLSRSGLFPSVQPLQTHPPPPEFLLSVGRFVSDNDRIDAQQLIQVINTALEEYYSGSERLTVLSTLKKEQDCYQNLAESIGRACFAREHICSYLTAIHPAICEAWVKMDENNRQVFMSFYNSSWVRNRHAMPLINARKIISAIDGKKLRPCCGVVSVAKVGEDFEIICHKSVVYARHLFNCTTPSYKLESNRLKEKILKNGLIKENIFGGVECSPDTLKILSKRRREHHFYALGAPAKGDVFYTSAMESIVRDVRKIIFNSSIFNSGGVLNEECGAVCWE